MPIYAYGCTACGAEVEYIQKFSDPPKEVCESCGGALKRLVTSAAFHLKGGGWYKDGYASAKRSDAESGAKAEGKSEGKAESKTEASPAAEAKKAPAKSGD